MQAFLETVVEKILLNPIEDLKDTLVIVPNRRAKLYINKYISESIKYPIWAPEIISINDFVFKQLNLQQSSSLELLIKLYEVHKTIEYKNPQEIDQFSNWGELLISDFNDIDLYLAPIDKLFKYLSDVKKIASWELDPDKLTLHEKRYIKFYEGLSKYYYKLQELLLKENKAYQGMAFRMLSENISKTKLEFKNIIIAGFNALSPSEEKIINYLKTERQANVFWDIDSLYFDNKDNEAGLFLRKQLKNEDRKKINFISDNWKNQPKNINIYGTDSNIAQVKFAAQLIDNNIQNKNYKANETAVVLANEDLMIPLLNSIPNPIEKFNLTMSYPLKYHILYELINILLDIYSGEQNKDNKFVLRIYHKKLLGFVKHPFVQTLMKENAKTIADKLENYINKNNISRLSLNDKIIINLKKEYSAFEKLINTFDKFTAKPSSAIDVLLDFLNYSSSITENKLDITFIRHFIATISDLNTLLSQIENIERIGTIKKWVNKVLNQSPIPFTGEPLEGLQIMGMLETRTLDYKNIIFISLNEGVIPTKKAYQSFILYEVKQEFGLPLPRENDAITSYHFYRLLQRAENINLIYNRSNSKMESGESSRFIKQIELELPSYNNKIMINHIFVNTDSNTNDVAKPIIIEKTQDIYDKLKTYINKNGLSPSSLNNYKKCSYYFYLQKIVNLKKDNEVEEQMAYNTQGNIIHETLEEAYLEYKGKQINAEQFKEIAKDIKKIFQQKLDTNFGIKNTERGKNYITKIILEKFISNYIAKENKFLEDNKLLEIVGLEEPLKKTININIEGEPTPITFKGSADRIDKIKSQIRIIDYKTGNVEESALNIKIDRQKDKWDYMFTDKYDKAFQLMMYAWMYWDKKPDYNSISSGITALKRHSKYYPLVLYKEKVINKEHIKRFEENLRTLVEEILDKNIPFKQREADKKCSYCDYNTICMRTNL